MTNPGAGCVLILEAFEAVTKNAEVIYHFYKFSKELEVVIPRLLSTLALGTLVLRLRVQLESYACAPTS